MLNNKSIHLRETVTCNFCQKDQSGFLFRATDRQYQSVPTDVWCDVVKCKKCGLIYLNPRVKEEYIGEFYPESEYYTQIQIAENGRMKRFKNELFCTIAQLYFGYPSSRMTWKSKLCGTAVFRVFPFRYRRLLPYIPQGKLLDFGFGNGDYLCRMQDLGWECWGIERDMKSIEHMKKWKISAYSDLWNPEIQPNYFDWVTAYHSIEHVYDPAAVLKRIYEILKPGGRVFIGVPNFDSFAGRFFGPFWDNLGVPIHPYIFTSNSITYILNKIGFKNIKVMHRSIPEGLLGSFQYCLNDLIWRMTNTKCTWKFIRNFKLNRICLLPIIKILDLLRVGDYVEVTAVK